MLLIIFLSFLFGFCMKTADLLDEHGLKLFRHANLVFGVAYGITGSVLFLQDPVLPSLLLALLIQWVLRFRVDYLNHGIAYAIILIYVVYAKDMFTIDWILFLSIFFICSFHGFINDAVDRSGSAHLILKKYFKSNVYVFLASVLLLTISSSYTISALSLAIMFAAYRLADIAGTQLIKQQKVVGRSSTNI